MKFQKLAVLTVFVPCALAYPHIANFPAYRSLAGLSREEIRTVTDTFDSLPGPQPLPPPINDTSGKLVNDADHPFMPLQPGDIRGPCPGLNTLASHGYLNRNGVVAPADMITAVQEGFNMGYQFASFLSYSGFVVDGNHLTNMMTIGSNTTISGNLVTGMNTHGTFEGDVSMTRGDAYFGNNFDFMEPLFDVLVRSAIQVGNGTITVEAAANERMLQAQDSIARNPELGYRTPRFVGATAESGFMLGMFANNQTANTSIPVTIDEARHFFDFHRFPDGFYRRQAPFEFPIVIALTNQLIEMVGIKPGHNEGVNNYIVDETDDATFCLFYQRQANSVATLYPDPTPELLAAIKANLQTYYTTLNDSTCPQVFPFGM